MSKLFKSLLSFLMAFSMLTFYSKQDVQAMEYTMGCDAYELAWVNDSGGFDTVACYGSFEEAKAALTQDDYVVRHPSSKSPTKIIAIASGIAYSYPRRNGSSTMNVYQHIDHITEKEKYKSTYVTEHRELFQPETVSHNGTDGNVKVVLMGFEGYALLSSMDLIPMKFIENRLTITLGGQTNDSGVYEEPFEMIPKMSFYSVVQNGNYRDLVYTYYSGYNSKSYSLTIGQAADWMSVGQIYYSNDGYSFYSDPQMSNYLATYYTYYLYLPMRSRTTITAETFNSYLAYKGYTEKPTSTSFNKLKENQSQMAYEGTTFVEGQNLYGVNALLTYAMACNESNYGRSNFAISKNNLFGWAAVDADPNNATQFASVSTGITEQMAYNLRGYLDVFDVRFFGMHAGTKESGFNVKYASDPYWGMKIAAISYDIDKFSKNYDGTLTDYDLYSLGVINEFKSTYYKTPSTSSVPLFTSEYSSQYQENHIVVLKGETTGFYQVQTPNAILADGTILKHKVNGVQQNAAMYDFSTSVGYIEKEKITLLNEFNDVTIPGLTPEGDFVYELKEFILDEHGILTLSGTAYRPGIYVNESNQLIHTCIVFDEYFERVTEARMTTVLKEDTKDVAQFEGVLDLNELKDGDYYFRLTSDYSSLIEYSDSRVVSKEVLNVQSRGKNYTWKVVDDTLWLNVSSSEMTELPEDANLAQLLEAFEYKNDSNTLYIKGLAYIAGIDAKAETYVEHAIQLIDMESKEVIEIPAETLNYDYDLSLGDGFTYKRIAYESEFDVSLIDSGCYSMKIVVRNGNYKEKSAYLMDQINTLIPESKVINGNQVRFIKNSTSCYRYELFIEKNSIQFDEWIKKPTKRNSSFGLESGSLDNGILSMTGIAWMYNVNFTSESNVSHQILLVDNEGNIVENEAATNACLYNYNQLLNTIFDWSNICFSTNIDLTKLESGVYTVYMDVASDGYRDVYEASNMYHVEIKTVEFEGRTYSITTSDVKDRLILTIE